MQRFMKQHNITLHLSMFTAQKMSEVVSRFFGRNAECLVLLLLGWSIRELTSCRAAAVFLSLLLFLLLEDAIKLQTTNVILQIKGAAGATEKTINWIVQMSLFIIISPNSPIPRQLAAGQAHLFTAGDHGNDQFNSSLAVLCLAACRISRESLIRLGAFETEGAYLLQGHYGGPCDHKGSQL